MRYRPYIPEYKTVQGNERTDNVKVGLHNHYKYSTAEGVFRLPRFFSTEKEMDKKAMELLHVFELAIKLIS